MKHIHVYLAGMSVGLIALAALVMSSPVTAEAQTSSCYTFTRNLSTSIKITSTEAAALKRDLVAQGLWDSTTPLTSYDDSVSAAVVQFQEKYAAEILTPSQLTSGTGYLGAATRAKLNRLYGCATPTTTTSSTSGYALTTPAATTCPVGYTCRPIAQTVTCPVGYTCTPNTTTSSGNPYASSNLASQYTQTLSNGITTAPAVGSNTSYGSNYSGITSYSQYLSSLNSLYGSQYNSSSYTGINTASTLGNTSGNSTGGSNTSSNSSGYTPAQSTTGTDPLTTVNDTTLSSALTQDTTSNDAPVGTNLPPKTDSVVTSAPTNTPFSFTVDYSKSLSSALSAAGIKSSNVDDNITLGLYPFTGSGTKTLNMRILTAKDFIPEFTNTSSSVISNTRTAADIFALLDGKGYRPATFQELLAFRAAYPQYFGSASAYGSEVHFKTPVQISTNWQNACPFAAVPSSMKQYCYVKSNGNTYYYVVPQITATAVNLVPIISLDGYNPINADSLKGMSFRNTLSAGDKFFVIEDAAAPAATVAEVSAAPTTLKTGPYTMLTSASYPVNVDYGKQYPRSTKNVVDNVSVPAGGTKSLTIAFAVIRGTQWTTDQEAKGLIQTIPGYRPATAQELLALNEQYPNQLDGVMGFGSTNPDCGGFPVLYKRDWTEYVGTPNLPPGVTNPKGATGYLDKTIVDINACIQVLPDGWFDTAPKDSKGGVNLLNIQAAGNQVLKTDPTFAGTPLAGKDCASTRRNTNYWKYAIVKM